MANITQQVRVPDCDSGNTGSIPVVRRLERKNQRNSVQFDDQVRSRSWKDQGFLVSMTQATGLVLS